MADGRYITLAELKGWGLDIDPTSVLANDAEMETAIARAEAEWDVMCSCRFDQQTFALVAPFVALVDGNGWLKLTAYEAGPVTAVTAVKVMQVGFGETTWKDVSWDATNGILLPINSTPPKPTSWDVMIKPSSSLYPCGPGNLYGKWSYTGGYAVIPPALKAIICRLAWWIWKLTREAPLGIVKSPQLGLVDIPLSMPPDIKADALLWSRGGS